MSQQTEDQYHIDTLQAQMSLGKAPWLAHTLVSIGLLALAAFAYYLMFATQPEAKRFGKRPAAVVTVETTQLQPTEYQVWIDSYGSATPLTLTNLVSDVSGRVLEVSNKIRTGSRFNKGDVLLRLEPRDYQIAVDVAEAAVAEADVKYRQEIAEAEIARQEWNIKPKAQAGKSLALREPQVKAAQASLQSAKARLDKAKLDLERTEIKAPFTGKVLKQNVDIGQVVSPSQSIAEIYATEQLEIRLPIKTQDLHQINLDNLGNGQIAPKVILESRLGDSVYQWFGQIVRSEGAYDRDNRMLYVVARVENPFQPSDSAPAMRVGQFFEAKIEGKLLSNVFALPRRSVTQDNMISIADEGRLLKIPVKPLWTDTENVVIQAQTNLDIVTPGLRTLSRSDQLILTPTANLMAGTNVRLIGEEPPKVRRPGGKRPNSNNDGKRKVANQDSPGNSTSANQ